MVLTICRHSAATPLVGRPTPVSYLFSLSRLALLPRVSLPLGRCRAARSARTGSRSWREGLCVSRTCPHALCVLRPFAFLSSALTRVDTPSRPLRLCPFSFRAHFTFGRRGAVLSPFERLSPPLKPFIPHPFGRRARLLISDCEGLCVMHGTRFAFTIPPSHTPPSLTNCK